MEYASTIWSPIMSDTNLEKLQIVQNTALRIITGCTGNTITQYLHDETETLPLTEHLRLHASQLKQKAALPTHPLHKLTQPTPRPRNMKQTIFNNWEYHTTNINTDPQTITKESNNQNLKTIHHLSVQTYLNNRKPNQILGQLPPTISKTEQTLPRKTRRTLAQLRTNDCPLLLSYLNKINPDQYPSPLCPLCKIQNHDTAHLFSCTSLSTTLTPLDLWNDPISVAGLLKLWEDVLPATV